MTYEDWLSKQSMSPISPEAYWAELAWLDGYKQGLILGNHNTLEGAWKYTQELIVNTFEYPKFEIPCQATEIDLAGVKENIISYQPVGDESK